MKWTVVYDIHALRQMRLRNVGKDLVEAVISKPDVDLPAARPPAERKLMRTIQGRLIKVWVSFPFRQTVYVHTVAVEGE